MSIKKLFIFTLILLTSFIVMHEGYKSWIISIGEDVPYTMIDMHYGVLHNAGFTSEETGGQKEYTIIAKHDNVFVLEKSTGLLKGQLIVVLCDDGIYRTTTIKEINNNVISVTDNYSGSIVFNFYNNHIHPNTVGYYAIADYAINVLGDISNSKHVVMGDSWINIAPGITERLNERIPSSEFIRAGVGGQVTEQIVDRFEVQATPENPDFVWLMAGTNDLNHEISARDYKYHVERFKLKASEINAHPIVFNVSVGARPITFDLSQKYYNIFMDN